MELTDRNFQSEVYESDVPVLVEFWGSWCPPCKMMSPIIDQLAAEYEGVVKVCKLNIDRNRIVPHRLDIKGVPAIYLFQNGEIVRREVGAKSFAQLKAIVEDGFSDALSPAGATQAG